MDTLSVHNAAGDAVNLAVDQNGSAEIYTFNKLVFGGLDTYTLVALASGLPVQPQTGSLWDIGSIAAGANLIGAVRGFAQTDVIYNAAVALTPKFAKIALATSGQVVAAVTGKKIRVLRLSMTVDAQTSASWRSNTTDLTGAYPVAAYGGWVEPFCAVGLFETVAGEALNLNLPGGDANVGGSITYVEV